MSATRINALVGALQAQRNTAMDSVADISATLAEREELILALRERIAELEALPAMKPRAPKAAGKPS